MGEAFPVEGYVPPHTNPRVQPELLYLVPVGFFETCFLVCDVFGV